MHGSRVYAVSLRASGRRPLWRQAARFRNFVLESSIPRFRGPHGPARFSVNSQFPPLHLPLRRCRVCTVPAYTRFLLGPRAAAPCGVRLSVSGTFFLIRAFRDSVDPTGPPSCLRTRSFFPFLLSTLPPFCTLSCFRFLQPLPRLSHGSRSEQA